MNITKRSNGHKKPNGFSVHLAKRYVYKGINYRAHI